MHDVLGGQGSKGMAITKAGQGQKSKSHLQSRDPVGISADWLLWMRFLLQSDLSHVK